MIDLKKTYKTRGGENVRLLCIDGPSKTYPVIGLVESDIYPCLWTQNGIYRHDRAIDDYGAVDYQYDLVEVKPKIVVEQWINVIQYNDGRTATDAFNREIDAQSQDYPVKVLARAVPFRWEGEG